MYFDEDMLLDIRLNTLNKYVKKFVIVEANYTHSGVPKKLKFDINKFNKFKDKIIYKVVDQKPLKIRDTNLKDIEQKNSAILDNAVLRENFQRNYLQSEIDNFHDEDLILISDLDEIPNLENFKYKKKITIFRQKMFMYKLNLVYPNFLWVGSKLCKKRYLTSPQWLRNISSKVYPIWRFDILFSKKKFNNIEIIDNGGWHFSNIKSPENINFKMNNFLHHLEYSESGLNSEKIKKIVQEKRLLYNYSADQKENKWRSNVFLELAELDDLPNYVANNSQKFKDWLDN
jgi:beta-1,4-mannosyl-glycoprotein beta-1,4-N-acetylglucosaminyltransferase